MHAFTKEDFMATSIRLDDSFEARLSRLASLTDRPKSFYI